MKKDFNKIKGGNRISDTFIFQEGRPAPLLEMNRLISSYQYFTEPFELMRDFSRRIEDFEISAQVLKESKEKAEYLNVSSFSLTQYFGSNEKALENYVEMAMLADSISTSFGQDKGGINGSCVIVQQYRAEEREKDILLLCYPGKLSEGAWEKGVGRAGDDIRHKFFAALQTEGLVTAKDLDDNGITLGSHGAAIEKEHAAQKAFVAKTAHVKNKL